MFFLDFIIEFYEKWREWLSIFVFQGLLTNNFVKILNLNTTPLFFKHTLRFLMRRDTSPVQYCYYFYSTTSFSVGNKRFDAIHLKQRKRSTQNQIQIVCSYYFQYYTDVYSSISINPYTF